MPPPSDSSASSRPRLFLSPPHMGGGEEGLVVEAFRSNWIAPLGPMVDRFEAAAAAASGTRFAAALSSGTAALHLGLHIAGVGPGDEVWVPSLTFIATIAPAVHMGATPVFFDCERSGWCMDPTLLSDALDAAARAGRLPKVVLPVDLYGRCADYASIEASCARHGVFLLEDAAEALGAEQRGRRAGSFGRCAALSFNGNKILTTSGGGALVSDDADLIARARHLSTQARMPAAHYEHVEAGFNYRLSNLLAAVGVGQLSMLEERVATRRRIHEGYRARFADTPAISFAEDDPDGRSNRWLTCILLDPAGTSARPEDVRLALEAENIEARPLWKPLHLQPAFRGCRSVGGSVAEDLFARGLCLPSGSAMTDLDLDRVADVVRRVVMAR